ncbi:hypothetical protein ACWC0A_25645 [Streptomyces scopuliridis]
MLTPDECAAIVAFYDEAERFRTTIDMARHRFGSGQYRYFTHELPDVVRELREAFYPRLLPRSADTGAESCTGRLDCPSALRAIARGHYRRYRVFFADESAAVAAGYRPCAVCLVPGGIAGDQVRAPFSPSSRASRVYESSSASRS